MDRDPGAPLHVTTWLSPGLPRGLFEAIGEAVARRLGRRHELDSIEDSSGPTNPAEDRFAAGTTDLGFVCATSYLWLAGDAVRSVELVPLAPVFDDPRADGMPVYFSDVVVAADNPIRSFADLAGRRVGFNDESSLSGYVSLLARLADDGHRTDRFGEFRVVGSHVAALASITGGDLDAAAVDANALRAWVRADPDRARLVRSIETLGPHPVQPIVVRASADNGALVDAAVAALSSPALVNSLRAFGVVGFAPVTHRDYETLRKRVAFAANARAPTHPAPGN